ncbi:hypothetical protein B0H13DRAFT_2394633 [Mycena leptocephala]|nr:hypothetical protein B0H13DRAFT_2394633 [Mycena leptocephala]
MRRRINLSTHNFEHLPSPPPRVHVPGEVPVYVLPSFDHLEYGIEPHIDFDFRALTEEQCLRDPEQPYFGDPLPEELEAATSTIGAEVKATTSSNLAHREASGHEVINLLSARLKERRAARRAAEREERFRKTQARLLDLRVIDSAVSPRAAIHVAEGGAMDLSLIEDRDYELSEVTGAGSCFCLRLIPWGAGTSRPVYENKHLVTFLGGRARNKYWHREVTEPATTDCDIALLSLRQPAAEKEANIPPTLTGGVGASFNEPPKSVPPYGIVLNALVFFQLFSSLAIKHLVGYGNRLLEVYCTAAFIALQSQKIDFLKHDPKALYPSDSSVFSAATFRIWPASPNHSCGVA